MTTFAKVAPKEVFDPTTGEVFVAYETSKIIKTRVREFDKLFIEDMDDLRNLQYICDYHLIMYIAKNMGFGTNVVTLNSDVRKKMAEYAKMNPTHISKAFKRLGDLDIIKYNRNYLMLNPKYMVRGTEKDLDKVFELYNNFK
jgi:hypothetical protein